tara:strand:+ start:493 stop:645 length:153 start_codon:yes stop_codon:yes gene_type:complete
MIDKPLHETFNKTSEFENLGDNVIRPNFNNHPITSERMKEICDALGFRFN